MGYFSDMGEKITVIINEFSCHRQQWLTLVVGISRETGGHGEICFFLVLESLLHGKKMETIFPVTFCFQPQSYHFSYSLLHLITKLTNNNLFFFSLFWQNNPSVNIQISFDITEWSVSAIFWWMNTR